MKKIMLLNTSEPEEQRMAIVEDGLLQEFDVERASKEQIKGNIYQGKVTRVEPAIQAAFIDYGGKKSGFLSLSELNFNVLPKGKSTSKPTGRTAIQDLLSVGNELLVQVIKEEREAKGPALTTYISLPGKYLVLLPGKKGVGISRKIEDEQTRKKLREMISKFNLPQNTGIIVRTAGLNRRKSELVNDLNNLVGLWNNVKGATKKKPAPSLIYQESNFVIRALRDNFDPDTSLILLDNPDFYLEAREFMRMAMSAHISRLKLYKGKNPLFSKYNLESQIEKIYLRSVPLKSGGSIVMESTEAMVTIDVNSGKATHGKDIEETAFNTNLEAAREIARQIRLRDLGGLIVIDFIDMRDSKHKQELEKTFKAAIKRDRAKIDLSRISRFGMIELSRQRLKPQITEGSFLTCPTCRGQGVVISPDAMAVAVYRKIQEAAAAPKSDHIDVIMPPAAANYLLNAKRNQLDKLEKGLKIKISVTADPELELPTYIFNSQKMEIATLIPQSQEPAAYLEPAAIPAPRPVAATAKTPHKPKTSAGRKFEAGSQRRAKKPYRSRPAADKQETPPPEPTATISKLTAILAKILPKKSSV